MNELILIRLAEQSGFLNDVTKLEALVELVVRECAEICLEANDHKNILRHFGVESK